MHILMRYGKKGLSLDLPCGLETDVIRKRSMPVLKEPAEAIRLALSSPVGCKPLKEAVRGRKEICVLICDNTRPVPHAIILPALIDGLIDAGAPPDSITMLIATGLHRPNEGGELRELIGSDLVLQTVKVVNHFARNDVRKS